MTLPIDLVLLRHGESYGNAAKRLSEKGDHEAIRNLFRGRHTRSFRLNKKGRAQAEAIGEWLRMEFCAKAPGFDRYYTSDYARALETAVLINLPGASWYRSTSLAERDWGNLDTMDEGERSEKLADEMRMRDIEPFFWKPGTGESFNDLCLRLRSVLDTLHRECSDKRVIIVCHGEVMWAFRILLERMSQERFKELHLSKLHEDRIYNCQVLHYTRRDPATGALDDKHANWMRAVRAGTPDIWTTGWQKIDRKRYTNDELAEIVKQYPTIPELE